MCAQTINAVGIDTEAENVTIVDNNGTAVAEIPEEKCKLVRFSKDEKLIEI